LTGGFAPGFIFGAIIEGTGLIACLYYPLNIECSPFGFKAFGSSLITFLTPSSLVWSEVLVSS